MVFISEYFVPEEVAQAFGVLELFIGVAVAGAGLAFPFMFVGHARGQEAAVPFVIGTPAAYEPKPV